MKRYLPPMFAVAILALPATAQANAGTALMWAGAYHMLGGNFVLGIFEGLLLAAIFDLRKFRTIGVMILANYFSAFAGFFFLTGFGQNAHVNLETAWHYLKLMVVLAYLATLLLEFPFIAWAMRRKPKRWRKSIIASVVIQTSSYIPLFFIFNSFSSISLLTQTHVVPVGTITAPANVGMYYIDAADGNVYQINLDQPAKRNMVKDLSAVDSFVQLTVQPSTEQTGTWAVEALIEPYGPGEGKLMPIKDSIAGDALPLWGEGKWADHQSPDLFYRPSVGSLGSAKDSPWRLSAGYWADAGLQCDLAGTDRSFRLALETPFLAWQFRAATVLPGDKVLLQLGDDQICLFDPATMNISLLARGSSPLPFLTDGPASTQPAGASTQPVRP